MKLNNLRIGVRLGGGFAILLVLLAFITGLGLWRLSSLSNATRQMMATPLTKERLVSEWLRNIEQSAAASESLRSQAAALSQVVAVFKL